MKVIGQNCLYDFFRTHSFCLLPFQSKLTETNDEAISVFRQQIISASRWTLTWVIEQLRIWVAWLPPTFSFLN